MKLPNISPTDKDYKEVFIRGFIAMHGSAIIDELKAQGFTVIETDRLEKHITQVVQLSAQVRGLLNLREVSK